MPFKVIQGHRVW